MEIQYSKQALNFLRTIREKFGEDIEETTPDEIDITMLHEIESNPDCKQYISSENVYKELGL